jgi:hypothetical protein
MRTQDTQGSFITLIQRFLAKVKEISDVASADSTVDIASGSVHPRADVVANLLMLRVLSLKIQKRLADEERVSERIFRYCSSNPQTPFSVSSLRGVLK